MFISSLYRLKALKTSKFNQMYYSARSKPDINRVMSEAEGIVGYPKSFLSPRWLLSDEISSILPHINKLKNPSHPLLMMAK